VSKYFAAKMLAATGLAETKQTQFKDKP